jgi:hypothetical protein
MRKRSAPLVFAGELEVEEDEFWLQADRLILRDKEVAFAFSGHDAYGPFQIDGVAAAVAVGRFATLNDTLFKPRGYDGIEKARLVFNELELSPKKKTCRVTGALAPIRRCLGDFRTFTSLCVSGPFIETVQNWSFLV